MKQLLITFAVVCLGCSTPVEETHQYRELHSERQDAYNRVQELNKLIDILKQQNTTIKNKNDALTSEQKALIGLHDDLKKKYEEKLQIINNLNSEADKYKILISADEKVIKKQQEMLDYYNNYPVAKIVFHADEEFKTRGLKEFQGNLARADGYKWVWNHTLPFCPRESLNRTQEQILEKAFRQNFVVINQQIIRPAYSDASKIGYSITYELNNSVEIFYIELESVNGK
jgi:DNA repair exonuclease SbcCD ATPase subunit